MSDIKSVRLFGMKVHVVNLESAQAQFEALVNSEGGKMIFTPNPEFVMKAQDDEAFMTVLNEGDLVVPDGIGIVLASKFHKLGISERVPGIELVSKMLEYAAQNSKTVYLFGGKPEVPALAAQNMVAKYPGLKIVGMADGYVDEQGMNAVLEDIRSKAPDIVLVALGAPKQEKWIYDNRHHMNAKVAMGVGGSLDVWAGTVKRAPKFFQKFALEWLYRLLKQPTRFMRMMVLPKFMIRVILTRDIDKKLK